MLGGKTYPITHRALRAAIELDLVTPAEIHENGASVHELRQSNGVAIITCGGLSWQAKNAGSHASPGGDWRAELAVYRAAHAIGDRKIVPDLFAYSCDHELIFTEALQQNWRRLDRYDIRNPWSVEVFARVATALARWHQASPALTGITPVRPWLTATLRGERREVFLRRADLDQLLNRILADSSLRSSLKRVERSWTSSHVMHGNLRLANVMFHTDGALRLINWEGSGWGDPRWDLAGLLQELHSAEIEQSVDTSAHRTALLNAYAERATSPSPLQENDPTLQAFVAARLMLRAIQIQSLPGPSKHLTNAHLAAARLLHRS